MPEFPNGKRAIRQMSSSSLSPDSGRDEMIPNSQTPPGASQFERVSDLIRQVYVIVDELESLFPRRFIPDGHLVGSIGEASGRFRVCSRITVFEY
jgi:hypothetical protein